MSGFEVCGVVLGVIPLVISALEHYKAGKGVAAALVKWRGLLDTLIFRLKDQRIFFYLDILELLRNAGVAQSEDGIDLTAEQCVAVLRDRQNGEEFREYLGLLHDPFLEILSRYELCLKTIVAKIDHIRRLPDVSPAPNPSLEPDLLRSPILVGIGHLLLGMGRHKRMTLQLYLLRTHHAMGNFRFEKG